MLGASRRAARRREGARDGNRGGAVEGGLRCSMRASAASVTATAVVAPARTAVAIVAASARVRSRLLAGTPAPVGLVEQRKFHDQSRHLREALEMAITPGWCAGSIGKPVNAAAAST
jgi:hypothetical protein